MARGFLCTGRLSSKSGRRPETADFLGAVVSMTISISRLQDALALRLGYTGGKMKNKTKETHRKQGTSYWAILRSLVSLPFKVFC